jgi:hypothetical protein
MYRWLTRTKMLISANCEKQIGLSLKFNDKPILHELLLFVNREFVMSYGLCKFA